MQGGNGEDNLQECRVYVLLGVIVSIIFLKSELLLRNGYERIGIMRLESDIKTVFAANNKDYVFLFLVYIRR